MKEKEKKFRVQFEISASGLEELKDMMLKTDLRTRKDLWDNALALLKWAIKEKSTGRIIASMDKKERKFKELVMPALENVRKR